MSRERDSMYRGNNNDCRIYVGNLPEDCRERDVDDIFYKYGKISDIRIKRGDVARARMSRRSEVLSYAFVQFDDPRDAEDAVRGRDGYEFDGRRIRVEFTRGSQSGRRDSGRSHGSGRPSRGVPPRRSNNRVLVKGLPPTGSWQDIKDHMRDAGEVLYAEVYGDGSGIVEFAHPDDVKYAVKNLDDTEFRSHENETSRVTVRDDSGGSGRKRSYSRSQSRSRSRSRKRSQSHTKDKRRSRSKSRSRSRSRSKSGSKSRSKSPSNSRSRSQTPRD